MKTKNAKVQAVADAIVPDSYKKAKCFAVMLFWQNRDRGIPEEVADPNEWMNTVTLNFEDSQAALEYYANTPCPASQLIEANSWKELEEKKAQMEANFKDKEWLNKNLYPYL